MPETKPHKELIQAAYKFSCDETALMNQQLRYHLGCIETLEDQKTAAMQDFKLRVQNAENMVKQLRMKLDAGEESRAVEALVEFHTDRGVKTFVHPMTFATIREEPMQPADWQLGMPLEEDSKVPHVLDEDSPSSYPAPAPAVTPIGEALDQATAGTDAPRIVMELTGHAGTATFMRAFRNAAKKAGWKEAQISLLSDRLKECPSMDAMIDTLKPHTLTGEPVNQEAPDEL